MCSFSRDGLRRLRCHHRPHTRRSESRCCLQRIVQPQALPADRDAGRVQKQRVGTHSHRKVVRVGRATTKNKGKPAEMGHTTCWPKALCLCSPPPLPLFRLSVSISFFLSHSQSLPLSLSHTHIHTHTHTHTQSLSFSLFLSQSASYLRGHTGQGKGCVAVGSEVFTAGLHAST